MMPQTLGSISGYRWGVQRKCGRINMEGVA